MAARSFVCRFFFFNDTATTEIYTLSLHDALPISRGHQRAVHQSRCARGVLPAPVRRSEEHTSELQSRLHLVCRLLLEKKKNQKNTLPAHQVGRLAISDPSRLREHRVSLAREPVEP